MLVLWQAQQDSGARAASTGAGIAGFKLPDQVPPHVAAAAAVRAVEAELDVLAQPGLQSRARRLHLCHGAHCWQHLLGRWPKIVSLPPLLILILKSKYQNLTLSKLFNSFVYSLWILQ